MDEHEVNGNKTSATEPIGLVVPGGGKARLLLWIYEGIQRGCQMFKLNLLMASTSSYFYGDSEKEAIAQLRDSGCKAVVLSPGIRTEEQLADDYLNREFQDFPIVLIDMAYPQQRRSQVIFDNYSSGFDMTVLLLSRGHRRIAFMTALGHPQRLMWRSNLDRFQGYLAALKLAGITPDASLQWHCNPVDMLHEQCYDWLKHWKNQPKDERASVLIAMDDGAAGTLAAEAWELGIAVPDDLTFAGFDNTADHPPVRRTYFTTAPDFVSAGVKAVELALRQLRGELDHPLVYMLPAPVVHRTTRNVESVSIPSLPPSNVLASV